MILIKPSYEILTQINREEILKSIERAGRTCYKSEDKISEESASRFVRTIMKSGHHSVIEHASLSVRFVCDRGVTHELVRHRLASYSQESTRYCNYSKDKFDNQITIIKPDWVSYPCGEYHDYVFDERGVDTADFHFINSCISAEQAYLKCLELGWKPQQARGILPNALKTEIVTTANIREWRWIFTKRCAPDAHPQIREVMVPLLAELKEKLPEFFEDLF